MKIKFITGFLLAGIFAVSAATTNELSSALQRGLFEEEANHNLDAAIQAYQGVITQYDKDRKLAATAVFRLAECYRKQNKTSEAKAQYERIVRDFSDQAILVEMSQKLLGGQSETPGNATLSGASPGAGTIVVDIGEAVLVGNWGRFVKGSSGNAYGHEFIWTAEKLEGADEAEERTATYRPNIPVAGRYDVELWVPTAGNRATNAPWLVSYDGGQISVRVNQRDEGGKWIKIAAAKRFAAGTNGFVRLSNNTGTSGEVVVAGAVRFVPVDAKQTIGSSSEASKELAELQALRVQTQADCKQNETILEQLKQLPRSKIKAALPAIIPDFPLEDLLARLAAVETELAAERVNLGKEHPDIKRREEVIKVLNEQIDSRVEGLITGLQVRLASEQTRLKDLDEQIKQARGGSSSSRTVFSMRPVSVGAKTATGAATAEEEQDLRRIQAMVKDSPDLINANDQATAGTFLHQAAQDGRLAVAKFLLENGAEVDSKDKQGATPLYLAAQNGHRSVAELLLNKGADVNSQNRMGATPLLVAVYKNFNSVAELLISKGANVTLSGTADPRPGLNSEISGSSPLHLAAGNGATNLMSLLLAHGAEVNARDYQRRVPLHKAASSSVEAVKLLLAHGADVEATNNTGRTPLHAAADLYRPEIAAVLLAKGAKINARTVEGRTPLFEATIYDKKEIVSFLLEKGADVEIPGDSGMTPLYSAVKSKDVDLLRVLLRHHANPNIAPSSDAPTALRMAVEWGKDARVPELVALLLGAGVDPNIAGKDGAVPLHIAAKNRDLPVVEMLLNSHADVNALFDRELTALDLVSGLESIGGIVVARPPGVEAGTSAQLIQLLKSRGGKTGAELMEPNSIFLVHDSVSKVVARKESASFNQLTLLEVSALIDLSGPFLPGPALDRVTIDRIDPSSGKRETINVDLGAILESGDCTRDQQLQWGDKVNIPRRKDGSYNQPFYGLSNDAKQFLNKCLARTVTVIVGGKTNSLILHPEFRTEARVAVQMPATKGELRIPKPSYDLIAALKSAGLLDSSADLNHAKLIRRNSVTGKSDEILLNSASNVDVWLRDGDVIAIPSLP